MSLEAQKEAILAFAARNDITIIEWFEEKETAAKGGRPIFSAMLKALRKGKAAGVVMHKIDRSARNIADWAKIGDLADAGIDVHFATESLDFRSRGGRLTADIQAVIAADYIRNLREETIKGLTGRLKQGIYPFKAPIGYLNNGGGKVKTIDPVRGPLVKRAFELYASGQHSIRTLQAEMGRLGLRSASGKALSKGCIEKMLANPFYAGVIRIKRSGASYRGIHELLITMDTFEAVQAIKAGKYAKKITRHAHTYRGLFQCRECTYSMIPERQKGHVYYRCQRTECPTNSIREESLERAVATMLAKCDFPEETLRAIDEAVERWFAENPRADHLQSTRFQLQAVEGRLEQLTDALIDRLIEKDTFNRRKETLLREQADLEQRLEKLSRDTANPQMVRRFLERIKNLAEHYIFAPPEEKRQIVEFATSNRTVSNKNVYLEPANWLQAAHETLAVFNGAHSRDASRRVSKFENQQIEQFIDMIRSPEVCNASLDLANILDKRHD